MATFDKVNVKDYDAAIIALFGSVDNYRNSPILKEINERIAYLEKIKELLPAGLRREHEAAPWWDLWSKVAYHIVMWAFVPRFSKKIDSFITRYKTMRPLPVKFFFNELNEQVNEFCNDHQKILKSINVEKYKYDH